jgi:hypothetical protein
MTRSVTHLFDDYSQARNAVAALERAGFTSSEVSVVSRYRDDSTLAADEPSGAGTGAAVGAIAGGGTGLLAALGIIAIPGIGPLVAAGVLATTLVGAAGGSVVGGLVGALTNYGVDERDAHVYSEAVRRGGTLVTVQADDARVAEAQRILSAQEPVDIAARRKYYADAGWSEYDPTAPGYTQEQIRKERELFGKRR